MELAKHIALRWSAQPSEARDYKHRAPTEHFRGLTHLSCKAIKSITLRELTPRYMSNYTHPSLEAG